MFNYKIKSYAKINLALNIVGKKNSLHKIESIVAFIDLHDIIAIKKISKKNHNISFSGKFSKNISKRNTVSKLLKILDDQNLLKNKKFKIDVNKKIPNKAGLGGGSMNASSILNFFIKKKIIKISKKRIAQISNSIGSDVILGLNPKNSILNSKNQLKSFSNYKTIHILIVKPNFGCSTEEIYSKVERFDKPILNLPNKNMFKFKCLKKMSNSLEPISFSKYPKLKKIKFELEDMLKPDFVRMTGSGSALVAYFQSKKRCERARKKFIKKYKNYWCITSKTI